MEDIQDEEIFFYKRPIYRKSQQEYIQFLLYPFRNREVTEELLKEIWDLLQKKKQEGKIQIPFKVVMRRDPEGKFPNYVEVILDTKV